MSAVTLLLARHGNTFEAGQPATWVGAHEDLPLTAAGEAQAQRLGARLAALEAVPSAIRTGPLQRTYRAAGLIAAQLGDAAPPLSLAPDLRELDYGSWSGLTDAEIAQRFGSEALEGWRSRAQFPEGAGWLPPRPEMDLAIAAMLATAATGAWGPLPLLVTSNGILRLIAAQLGEGDGPPVKTGHVCVVTLPEPRIVVWNLPPDSLTLAPKAASPGGS